MITMPLDNIGFANSYSSVQVLKLNYIKVSSISKDSVPQRSDSDFDWAESVVVHQHLKASDSEGSDFYLDSASDDSSASERLKGIWFVHRTKSTLVLSKPWFMNKVN